MKLPFKIKQVKPRIFLFEFTDQYDMGMHFLRYQEFYESPNTKFRNKSFTILDFMEWYSKNHENKFTYCTDWGGYNFPSNIISNCLENILDYNRYDLNMELAYNQCIYKIDKINRRANIDEKFYIIGAMKGNESTLKHETAHGYYYLNSSYKKETNKLVKALPIKFRKNMETMLAKMGYTKQVFVDEIQAYYSTTDALETYLDYYGAIKLNKKDIAKLHDLQKPFIETFKKYNDTQI